MLTTVLLAVVLLIALAVLAAAVESSIPAPPPLPGPALSEHDAPWAPADHRHAGRHAASRGARHA